MCIQTDTFRKELRLRGINWLVFVMEKQYDIFKVWTKFLIIFRFQASLD